MEHAAPRKKDKQNEDGHNPADAQQHETGTSKVKNQAVGALSGALTSVKPTPKGNPGCAITQHTRNQAQTHQ